MGVEQLDILYNSKKKILYLIKAIVDPVERVLVSIERVDKTEVERNPINLVKPINDKEEISFLKKLMMDILTEKYPTPLQLNNLSRIVENPDNIYSQAVLSVCKESVCLCPLFFSRSLTCPEFSNVPISPANRKAGLYELEPRVLWEKKFFVYLFSALRQYLSVEEMAEILAKIQEKMSAQEGVVIGKLAT